ncbi:MAG TPA: hypothetical protein VFM52_02270, partial [Rhodanobacter sp.]|nr:hypothetical protein [Rhodanobacter sp.]
MSILVFGASSQIGHFLLPRLRHHGMAIYAVSRHAHVPGDGIRWLRGQLPDAVPDLSSTPSAVISFGPIGPFAAWLATTAFSAPPRVIATSSMSAETKRSSAVPAERALSQQLRTGEHAIADACARLGAPWTIFRPTLVYGAGLDRSLTPIA